MPELSCVFAGMEHMQAALVLARKLPMPSISILVVAERAAGLNSRMRAASVAIEKLTAERSRVLLPALREIDVQVLTAERRGACE